MNLPFYEIQVARADGEFINVVEPFSSLEYVKTVNGVGSFAIAIPKNVSEGWLKRDNIVIIKRRQGESVAHTVDFLGFLNGWKFARQGGVVSTILSGFDQNSLLGHRIVNYNAGTAQALANAEPTDDLMKRIVRENLGSSAVAARDLSSYGFSVASDLSLGPNSTMAFAWRNVLAVLEDLSEASRILGDEVFWGVYLTGFKLNGLPLLEFQTRLGQPGKDRTWAPYSDPVIFSPSFGNLRDTSLDYDYGSEANYIIVGGPGQEDDRTVYEAANQDSINISVWGRRERFFNASQSEDSSVAMASVGSAIISANRPFVKFGGKIQSTQDWPYGTAWGLGDRISAQDFGVQVDGIIRQVHVRVTPEMEDVSAYIEGEVPL